MKTKRMTNSTRQSVGILKACVLALFTVVLTTNLAHATDTEFDYASQTLRVGVWIEDFEEGDVLERGEEIATGFQTNEDAYAVVYRINSEGLVTVLWPRSRMDDGFVFGGHEYLLPVTGGPRLVASSRPGEGFIEAIVSRYPFDLRELALDFHHEYEMEKYNFMVVGDPFLAINEVNFAVTGMEDSADFVVTNYLSYYVHEQVEHPRYLCNQCHMDDDYEVNPYNDECTIDITVDYGWGNDWYGDVGYYPIYHNPVYVYYDPWTWRPWVNFWYDPFYRCPTRPGYHWNHAAYVWCDSPYYKYDGVRRKSGRGLYQHPNQANTGRRKTTDYTRVSGQVAQRGPSDGERESMRQKRRIPTDVRGDNTVRNPGSPVVVRGEKPMVRPRPNIETPIRGSSRGGLQIRNTGGRKPTTARGSGDQSQTRPVVTQPVRGNVSGGGSLVRPGRGTAVSGSGSGTGGNTTVRGNSRPQPNRGAAVSPSRGSSGDARIKPVEPRKKGTRIWNSRSGTSSTDRKVRNPSRSNTGGKDTSGSKVQPRSRNSSSKSSGNSSSPKVKPKSNTRSSSGASGSRSNSSGGSSSKSSSGKSSSKSKSSKSGRDGGSSRSKR
jgi:hypothetical protein